MSESAPSPALTDPLHPQYLASSLVIAHLLSSYAFGRPAPTQWLESSQTLVTQMAELVGVPEAADDIKFLYELAKSQLDKVISLDGR